MSNDKCQINLKNNKSKKIFSRFGFVRYIWVLIFGFWISSFAHAVPQRIISTMPSITEILFAVGAGDKVVGVTTQCNFPEKAKKIEKVGGMTVNLEKIISLKPDLIVMLQDAQSHDVWRLRARNLPVISVNPHTIDETLDSIQYIGSNALVTWEARRLVLNLRYRLNMIDRGNRNKPDREIFVMVGYNPLVSAGRDTFIDDIIKKAGGKNVIEGKSSYPQISFEELYKLNPEYIIIPDGIITEKALRSDQKLGRLTAVQNGKILFINPDIIFRPGPRVIDAVEQISEFIEE